MNLMLLYLHKGKSIGQRTIFRQIRSIIILLLLFSSYWLVNRNLLIVYYILSILSIVVLILDYQRSKTVLADPRIKFADYVIIILTNILLAGTVWITSFPESPLMSILLVPVILFSAEFGSIVGVWNLLGMTLFMLFTLIFRVDPISIKTLAYYLTLIVCGLTNLFIIRTFNRFHNHYYRKIERLLNHDELTGLYNRRFLKSAVLRRIKTEKNFGLILIDVNYFKYFNDFWGHSSGDILLINIGKIINKSVRSQDIVVRHSGDEFIVLLPESNQSTVKKVITKIIESIESHHFPGEECFPDNKLSISYGFSIFPDDAIHYQDLFTIADRALYNYKKERFQ